MKDIEKSGRREVQRKKPSPTTDSANIHRSEERERRVTKRKMERGDSRKKEVAPRHQRGGIKATRARMTKGSSQPTINIAKN